MPFTIPNFAAANADGFDQKSAPDKGDIDILVAAHIRTGILSGGIVTAQGSPNNTVAVSAWSGELNGIRYAASGSSVTIATGHATLPRRDLIYGKTGNLTNQVVAGTPAVQPELPAVPSDGIALGVVEVSPLDTVITSNQITDKRMILSPTPLPNVTAFGVKADLEYVLGNIEGRVGRYFGSIAAGTNIFISPTPIFVAADVGKVISFPDSRSYSQGSGTGDGRQNTGANFVRNITAVPSNGLTATFDGAAIANAIGYPTDGTGSAPFSFYAPAFLTPTSVTAGFSTTAGSAAATCANRNFQTADIGKVIEINGAGANHRHFYGTIAGGTPGTSAYTLSANAGSTVSGVDAWIGTDDTVAWQAALDAFDTVVAPPMNSLITNLRMNEGQTIIASGHGPKEPFHEMVLATTMTNVSGTVVVSGTISADTPPNGIISVGNHDVGFEDIWYTSYTGSTFTVGTSGRGVRNTVANAHTGGAVGERVWVKVPGMQNGGTRLYRRGHSVAQGNALGNSASLRHMIAPYTVPAANASAEIVSNVQVLGGLRLNGRQEWLWDGDGQPGQTQNQHGISLWGAHYWYFEHVVSENHDGDGMYIGRSGLADAPSKARYNTFLNCIFQDNLRNGVMYSDGDYNILAYCIHQRDQAALSPYHRKWMGSNSAGSTYTSAELDYEPNIAGQTANYNLNHKCIYRDSWYLGVQISRPTAGCECYNNTFDQCLFQDNRKGNFETATNNVRWLLLKDCIFRITPNNKTIIGRHLRHSAGSDNVLQGCKFFGEGSGVGSTRNIQVDNGNGVSARVTFRDCYMDLGGTGSATDSVMCRSGDATGPTIYENNYFQNMGFQPGSTDYMKENRFGANVNGGGNIVGQMRSSQSGTVTVTSGNTTVTLNHTCIAAPSRVLCNTRTAGVSVYPSTISTTQVIFTISAAAGGGGVVIDYHLSTPLEDIY